MAAETKAILKTTLGKVLTSKGEKKFFFAYAGGRRKDGKGDGELAVLGKKPKKEDVEGELAEKKDYFEGFCWTGNMPENAETIYFQGKGKQLSAAIVAKMVKTAKLTAGKQYDFQIPSEAEELRAAKLKEGDEEEVPAAPPKATAAPAPAKAPPASPKPQTAAPTPAQTQAADFAKKMADWTPALKAAMAAKGPHAATIAGLLAEATTLAKPGGNMAHALAKLTECHALATGASGGGTATATAPKPDGKTAPPSSQVPVGKVAAAVVRAELEQVRLRAVKGIDQLAAALRRVKDPRGPQVAGIITKLATSFPGEMEPLLQKLETAVQDNKAAQVPALKADIQKAAKTWLAFLQEHAKHIHGCETNPLGVSIQIADPIRAALKSIVKITA
jgi:hypothetical protein